MAAGIAAPACLGQGPFDSVDLRGASIDGIHLNGVSIFSGYTTSAYPLSGLTLQGAAPINQLGWDVPYGVSASVGWQRNRETRTSFSLRYTATYGGSVQHSNLNALNQSLSFSGSRMFGEKWTFNISATGQYLTLEEYLYQPTSLSVTSQTPATFDNLAAASGIGQFSDTQSASALTSAPALESPARSLLLGERILSYTGQMSVNYNLSEKLHLRFASIAAGGQNRTSDTYAASLPNYVMPLSIGFNGGLGLSYAISSRTQLSLNVDGNRLSNHYQGAYTTTASASFGRKMGMNWFLRLMGGGSLTGVTAQSYGTPATKQAVFGGSVGYQTRGHTLLASINRSSYDNYGFAVGTNTMTSGAWNWRRPGSRWSLRASFGQQQIRNTGFASLSGWQASTGLSARLADHLNLTGQYVHANSTGSFLGNSTQLALNSIRLTLSWSPQTAEQAAQR